MAKWIFLLLFLVLPGCKATLSLGVHKDWSIEGHPLDSPSFYRPDCKTDLRLSFEKDFNKK